MKKIIMRKYHITYFLKRGDLNASDETLLSGITIDATDVLKAVEMYSKLVIQDGLPALTEIKYIIEL
jgi:hypothetical protein